MVGDRIGSSSGTRKKPQEIRRPTVILVPCPGEQRQTRQELCNPLFVTLGAAASDAMLWRAFVSTTKRSLSQAIEKRQKEIWFGALGKPYLHAAQLSPVPSCWDNIVECRR
jgi:hypothetical protein